MCHAAFVARTVHAILKFISGYAVKRCSIDSAASERPCHKICSSAASSQRGGLLVARQNTPQRERQESPRRTLALRRSNAQRAVINGCQKRWPEQGVVAADHGPVDDTTVMAGKRDVQSAGGGGSTIQQERQRRATAARRVPLCTAAAPRCNARVCGECAAARALY